MKRRFFLVIILVFCCLKQYAQIQDSFDRSFMYPWQGDTVKFQLAGGQLQSNSSIVNDQYYISRASSNQTREWLLDLYLKFNTSSVNYIDFYLLANGQNLTLADTALFIRVGNTKDEVSLYQRTGGGNVLLINGMDGVTNKSNSELRLRARILNDSITLDYATHLNNPIFSASQTVLFDTSQLAFGNVHTGLLIRQSTASFFNDHFFDNMYAGSIQRDTSKPAISQFRVNDSSSVSLFFSEELDSRLLQKLLNYQILETGQNPISALSQSGDSVQLNFADAFSSGQLLTLLVDSLLDLSGNHGIQKRVDFSYRRIVLPAYKSLLVSEIFMKPGTSGLKTEAFEIYNASDEFISTKDMVMSDLNSDEPFPELVLPPKSYWVVCDDSDTNDFGGLNIIPLKTLPSLNDGQDLISLNHSENGLVCQVLYDESWHDAAKMDGGWSLEMRDIHKGCCTQYNYSSSINVTGHTLGKTNSVQGSAKAGVSPKIRSIYIQDSSSILLRWNTEIDYKIATSRGSYELNPAISLDSIQVNRKSPSEVILFGSNLISGPVQLVVKSFLSCGGEQVNQQVYDLNRPGILSSGDLQITEIMFNSETSCSEFIELDNTTGSILDLKSSFLGASSSSKRIHLTISSKGELLFPHQKLVLAQDLEKLKKCHAICEDALFLELKGWSSLDDRSGSIWVTNFRDELIDTALYNETYHSILLSNKDGVSLEKIDTSQSGLWAQVWSSSGFRVNYATPGCGNTQISMAMPSSNFSLGNPYFQASSLVSPKASIQYKLEKPNYKLSIRIMDKNGILVKQIVNNALVGLEGTFFWDGTDSRGQNSALGIYFIYINAVHSDGSSETQVLEITKLD